MAAILDNYIIKTIPSVAESREEQDGSNQTFVGQTIAELQAVFHLSTCNEKQGKEMKINPAEEGDAYMIKTIRTGDLW